MKKTTLAVLSLLFLFSCKKDMHNQAAKQDAKSDYSIVTMSLQDSLLAVTISNDTTFDSLVTLLLDRRTAEASIDASDVATMEALIQDDTIKPAELPTLTTAMNFPSSSSLATYFKTSFRLINKLETTYEVSTTLNPEVLARAFELAIIRKENLDAITDAQRMECMKQNARCVGSVYTQVVIDAASCVAAALINELLGVACAVAAELRKLDGLSNCLSALDECLHP